MSKRLILAIVIAAARLGMQACATSSTQQTASTVPTCAQGQTDCQSESTKSSWDFSFRCAYRNCGDLRYRTSFARRPNADTDSSIGYLTSLTRYEDAEIRFISYLSTRHGTLFLSV
jgi:hypothetical protein